MWHNNEIDFCDIIMFLNKKDLALFLVIVSAMTFEDKKSLLKIKASIMLLCLFSYKGD